MATPVPLVPSPPSRKYSDNDPRSIAWGEIKTEADRWLWHAEDYAFRRCMIGDYTTVSPCDPEGRFFDQGMVDVAVKRYRRWQARRRILGPIG